MKHVPVAQRSVSLMLWALLLLCTACSHPRVPATSSNKTGANTSASSGRVSEIVTLDERGSQVVLFALGLLNIDYRFGGSHPDTGLDCSGMVAYIYQETLGVHLPHNAAQIAAASRVISTDQLQPGDLVFFNTMDKPYSHVGLYLGEQQFIHAPSRNGKIRVDSLSTPYYAQRLHAARRVMM